MFKSKRFFFAADIQDGGRKTCATRRNRIVYSIQEVPSWNGVSKGDKANFRCACKKLNITNEQYRKGKKLVITCKNRHEGLGDCAIPWLQPLHRGRTSTYEKYQKDSIGITYPTT